MTTIIILCVFGGIALIFFFFMIGIYNRLVTLKNRFQNAFSQIEVQLQRRYDLIPNLIETVKGYMKHEKETLDAVIQARNSAMGSLQSCSANPGTPAPSPAWPAPRGCWAAPWAGSSPSPRPTPT